MSITIQVETEAKLREWAVEEGQDVDAYADALLNMALEWQARDRTEAVEGIRRGMDAFAEGRFRPFPELAAEQRERFSLSSTNRPSK